MKFEGLNIGYALTGSFCTIEKAIDKLEELVTEGASITPIVTDNVLTTDTRFGKAKDFIDRIEKITNRKVIKNIFEAEPIGPKKLLDLIVIAPCTGNTLAKLTNGISDTSVTLATKAHLRNQGRVLLSVATNDGLGTNAKNIGLLLNTKNVFFVPFGQDNHITKVNSLISNLDLLIPSIESVLKGEQYQPVLLKD